QETEGKVQGGTGAREDAAAPGLHASALLATIKLNATLSSAPSRLAIPPPWPRAPRAALPRTSVDESQALADGPELASAPPALRQPPAAVLQVSRLSSISSVPGL